MRAFAEDGDWADTFYQFRIPVEIDVSRAGWNLVPITEADVSTAIGKLEEYSFVPSFLAYNHLRVLEVDAAGQHIPSASEAGFYLIADGGELVKEPHTSPIPTEKDAYYLVSFLSEGGTFPPTTGYEQVFPIGEPPRSHAYMSSYVPRVLPKKRKRHECLLRSDGNDMKLNANGSGVSVKRSRIKFLANFEKPGRKRLVLYYQPFGAHYLKVPQRRRASIPSASATIVKMGEAEKYIGATKYKVLDNGVFQAWFADTTVKLTPATPVPQPSRKSIRISTAANEAQSFQVVLRPRKNFKLDRVQSTSLTGEHGRIDAANVEVRSVNYVPVTKKARINQVKFFGPIGDPLVEVEPMEVDAERGNVAFWVTVRTPPGTPADSYIGKLLIQGGTDSAAELPVAVKVHDFELPEFSTFHTHMGGQFFAKNSGDPKLNPTMAYHGVKSKSDLKKLARTYYEFMAREKFYPKNVALFVEIGMKWKRPPQGYDVDAPGNFFELVDWDFTEFNQTLEHFIDELKVNSVCLTHTNPSVSHIFKHLPGEPVATPNSDPGHVTMGWQTFRKMTQATYDKREGDPWFETSVKVTRKQWDRLVLDYYRAMARNLEEHGWLDKFYYLIDETSGTEKILHLIRLLKSDPLTAKIRFAHCLQGFECLWHQEDGEYVFNKWLTYVPQVDENYYRWEDYYWDDYNIPRQRERLWSYAAYSSRLGINTPGITNREIGLEVFNLGGSGYVIWDTFMWHHHYGLPDDPHNPWKEPYARLANGALCYFYPPQRDDLPQKPDFTVTPSLRVMTYRESVDDYEYARILEDLVQQGEKREVDVAKAKAVLGEIPRMFPSSVEWTLNDAWYLELRERMAEAIVDLKSRLED